MKTRPKLISICLLFAALLPAAAQAQFTFVTTNNVTTITGYTGSNSAVVIPKQISGLPVAIIGTSAFANLTNLTSVTLPDTVATISQQAFYNCTGLTNVSLGSGVTTIGNYAFEYCSNLAKVTIPASIQSLGAYAFAYCSRLNGAYFQGNAPYDSGASFYSDPQAVVYYFPWTTGWGQTFGYAPTASYVPPVPFNYTTNNGAITITGYTGSDSVATIPGTIYDTGVSNFLPVTSIGANAFAGSFSLLTVVVPGGVTNLGSHAFSDCTNLISVFFAGNAPGADATVFLNDDNAFVYCLPGTTGWSSTFAGVPTVQLPYLYTITNGTIVIRSYTGPGGAVAIPGMVGGLPVVRIGNGAFARCGSLTSVTIPDSVTEIGNGAFALCGGLTSVTMPDSVADLGIYAFYACSNLASVTISTNTSNIGVSAFDSCTGLTNLTLPDGVFIIGASAFQNCVSLANVTIPTNVMKIGGFAFQNCAGLTNVAIPASVRDIGPAPFLVVRGIGPDAFGACGRLLTITVDPQNTNYSSSDGVLLDKNQTSLIQYPGGKAGNYIIPNSVTAIGNFAFDACAGLTGAVVANNNVTIGDWAFTGCSGLTNVVIVSTNSITIGSYAFESCSNLKSADISIFSSNGGIGYHSFAGCTGLTDVTEVNLFIFPFNGLRLLSDCPNLTSIYLLGSSPQLVWNPTNQIATPTAYYLPWADTSYISGLPTAVWLPRIQNRNLSFGLQANQFGFNINWAGSTTVVVEVCRDLAAAVWTPLATNTFASTPANGSVYFSDPLWTNYPSRFYRVRGLNPSQP